MGYAELKNHSMVRRVFGHHAEVLRGLLNDLLDRHGEHEIASLEYLPPDQVPKLPGVNLSLVDVMCREVGGATFVVEMQVLPVTGFLNRAVYDACKAYVGTRKCGDTYDALSPVVAVTVCDFELWPDEAQRASGATEVPMVSHWRMSERLSGAVGIPQVEYVFCELPKLRGRRPETVLERWVALFSAAPTLDPKTVAKEPFTNAQREALELANEATFSELELDAYRKARDEVQQMVQYGRDAEARGRAEGEAAGEAKGLRAALLSVCELLAIELSEAQRAWVDGADASELAQRLADVKRTRRWT